MLANDLRRLAEEIAGAYEARIQGIANLKRETAETLDRFQRDLSESNKERAKSVRAELTEMGETLRSDLRDFRDQLAGFKKNLDLAEQNRKDEARVEIADRSRYISGLRNDTRELINDFETNRKQMWGQIKSGLQDFTSALEQYKHNLVDSSRERMNTFKTELADMKNRLRSQLGGFMTLLKEFKTDLDTAESLRKEQALSEIRDRKADLKGVLGGTQEMLSAFGNARKQMWIELTGQLDAFTSELAQFKANLDRAEKDRQETMGREISERREHIENLKDDTRNLINDFENVRQQMWGSLKSELDAFTSGLARFKSELEAGERKRLEIDVREMREKGEELKAGLRDFKQNLSSSVGKMLGVLERDRSEAARAWHEILSAVRSGQRGVTQPEPAFEAPAEEVPDMKYDAGEEGVRELEEVPEPAEKEVAPEFEEPAPMHEAGAEADDAEDVPEALQDMDTESISEEILSVLEDTPEGLRMVEIAEHLRIENWRSLIPVIRELLEAGEIRKEDSTYFIA